MYCIVSVSEERKTAGEYVWLGGHTQPLDGGLVDHSTPKGRISESSGVS